LVAALPERYQQIYGFPEYDDGAVRGDHSRLIPIRRVVSAMQRLVSGRALRVLDVGCAQAFYTLSVAGDGIEVAGVDAQQSNIDLCRALSAHAGTNAAFQCAEVGPEWAAALKDGEYDVILALSMVHHIAHARGRAAALETVQTLGRKGAVLLLETAVREEPLYWAAAQPERAVDWVRDYVFHRALAWSPTHLSAVQRPLFFASNQFALIGDELFPIETAFGRSFSDGAEVPQRRYYWSDRHTLLKTIASPTTTEVGQLVAKEIAREVHTLSSHADAIGFLPAVRASETNDDFVGCALRLNHVGKLLYERLQETPSLTSDEVNHGYHNVLNQLAALESRGLFHSDIRTWNVIVCNDGRFSLIDFGALRAGDQRDVLAGPDLKAVYGSADATTRDAAIALLHEILNRTRRRDIQSTGQSLFFHWPAASFEEPYRSFVAACAIEPSRSGGFGAMRDAFARHVLNAEPLSADGLARGLVASQATLASDFNQLKLDSFLKISSLTRDLTDAKAMLPPPARAAFNGICIVTPNMLDVWNQRVDLQRAFPAPSDADGLAFAVWFLSNCTTAVPVPVLGRRTIRERIYAVGRRFSRLFPESIRRWVRRRLVGALPAPPSRPQADAGVDGLT
jgi:SAM-dependent methyltransferase